MNTHPVLKRFPLGRAALMIAGLALLPRPLLAAPPAVLPVTAPTSLVPPAPVGTATAGTGTAGIVPLSLIRRLSLQDAVDQALQSSPAIQEVVQDAAMAGARITGVEAAGKPSLSATMFASHSSWSSILNTPDVTPPVNLMGVPPGNFLDQNITAMLPIYTGGRIAAATAGARRLQDASEADLETTRQDVALQTGIAYRRVLYQKVVLEAEQQNLTAAQAQLSLDTDRYTLGKLAEVTLYRDRTLAANAQQEVTNAGRDLQQALFALETVMGVNVQSQLTLTDALVPPTSGVGDTPDLPSLLQLAEAHRPELRAARERTAAARDQLRLARCGSNPQVNLMGMADLTHAGSGVRNGANYTVGIAAGAPLFEGGALSAAEKEAAAALRKARTAETAVQLQLNSDVAGAWVSLAAAQQNIGVAQTAVAQAQEEYNVQQLRFQSGKGLQLEVLDALAALTTARIGAARAAFEYAVAQDQLLRATGTIPSAPGLRGSPSGTPP